MAKVTAKDANGKDVPVLQAQFNNRGEVESILISDGKQQKWVFASDYQIEVDEGAEQEQPEGVMAKDTKLKPGKTVKKGGKTQATGDGEERAG